MKLELLESYPEANTAVVRSCTWNGGNIASWEVDIISNAGHIPQDLRVDILGSRRKILFVEGSNLSLDGPMYSVLFPDASVRSRGSSREVERAVTGLCAIENLHHANAFGMIDNDGMSAEQVAQFEAKGIYPLSVHSVESLYYSPEVLAAVAQRQGETFSENPATLLSEATTKGLEALDTADRIPHLASRIAERRLRDQVSRHLPSREALMDDAQTAVAITIPSSYPAEHYRLQDLRSRGELYQIIASYPVRESGVLDAIARALRFTGRAEYERAALSRVSANETLQEALRSKLGLLSAQLA